MWRGEMLGAAWVLRPVRSEGRCQTRGDLGMAGNRPRSLPFYPRPGGRIRHQGTQHRMIELVAPAQRAVSAEQRRARKRQIADCVQHLVANELVGETRTLWVENTIVADYERIFEGGTERVTGVPQARHVAQEAEGACACDVAAERVGF